ncbi:MAG: hypothetical protein EXR83_14905, partial [Gammaproteobacteria bacterium]|nr:hypothetical protein [Gammaproteobacteria bacterium]
MNNNFRMTKIAAALATAGLAAVPSFAFAAANASTTANMTVNFRAPMILSGSTTTFTPAYGLAARHSITRDGTAANLDGMEAVAFLYDAANAYVGFVRGGATGGVTKAVTGTVTVPSAASGATQAVFALFYHGQQADVTTASDDTLNGNAADVSGVIFVPTGPTGRTGFTPTYLNATAANGGAYATINGATLGQLNAMGAHSTVNSAAFRVTLDSSYGGPVLSGAAKDALTPTNIRVTWNAAMAKPANDTNVSATIVTRVGTTAKGTPATRDNYGQGTNYLQAAGGNVMYLRNNANIDFTDAIDTITVAGNSGTITDEAGNPAKVNNAGVTLTTYTAPTYALSGTVAIV